MLSIAALIALLHCSVTLIQPTTASWKNLEPKVYYRQNEYSMDTFSGNQSMNSYLKLLYLEKDTVLIGGKNVVYNISLENLSENKDMRIIWESSGAHRDLCALKGKPENACQNYIRVGGKTDQSSLYVCGTNSYKPLCQIYSLDAGVPTVKERNIDGNAKSPYDPKHNSTATFSNGKLFTATSTDFAGNEPVIYKEPLYTQKSDLTQLSRSDFVGLIPYHDYMLVFYRELAVEYMNCGKVVVSRVGRVCQGDKGGQLLYLDRWTTFLKSRLNCSLPGDFPFYFDEIQAVSEIIEGDYAGTKEQIIYGVFNTPYNSVSGSAVCAFNVKTIMNVFDNGTFKAQENMNANWLPYSWGKVPDPRPGLCVNDSRTLPGNVVNFINTHPIMDEVIPAFHSRPTFTATVQYRLSAIAVEPQVPTISGEMMDVVFVGTDDGRIIKTICVFGKGVSDFKTVVVEELQVLNSAIRKLSIVHPSNSVPKLLIISDTDVSTIPLQRCGTIKSCKECVALQDPYCSWNTNKNKCVAWNTVEIKDLEHMIQNVTIGQHRLCSLADTEYERKLIDEIEDNSVYSQSDLYKCPICPECSAATPCESSVNENVPIIYVTDSFGAVVVICILITLAIGFFCGFLCSRYFRGEDRDPYSNVGMSPCPNHQRNRFLDSPPSVEGNSSFLPPCSNSRAAALNLVLNMTKNPNDKNTVIDNKSLQKVKKTYI